MYKRQSQQGRLYHIGTVPTKHGRSYVADLRMMIHSTSSGFRPLAMYARRATAPLVTDITEGRDSWEILGTNLSIKKEDGAWGSDTSRLMLMDRRDFNKLGIGLDDMIDAYIQTVLATIAIDQMSQRLISQKGNLRSRLFRSLNNDPALMAEILPATL